LANARRVDVWVCDAAFPSGNDERDVPTDTMPAGRRAFGVNASRPRHRLRLHRARRRSGWGGRRRGLRVQREV